MSGHTAPPGAFVNMRALPIGHWVGVRLPDGRDVVASHDEPIVAAMRRMNAAIVSGKPPDPAAVAAVAEWADSLTTGQLALWEAS